MDRPPIVENYKDSFIRVVFRQRLGIRAFWLGIYYALGNAFPRAPLPLSGAGMRLRAACVKRIFQHVGKDVTVHAGVTFGSGAHIEIGDYSSLNVGCSIANDTIIGRDVMMGPEVLILSGSHNFQRLDIPMREQGAPPRRAVRIGDDVWIGARSILLPGVIVGNHCILAAGSIVTKEVPDYAVVAGNPARIIRFRNGSAGDMSSAPSAPTHEQGA
jgi:maltose O-acetyltransferase